MDDLKDISTAFKTYRTKESTGKQPNTCLDVLFEDDLVPEVLEHVLHQMGVKDDFSDKSYGSITNTLSVDEVTKDLAKKTELEEFNLMRTSGFLNAAQIQDRITQRSKYFCFEYV